jgi:hypothetical protein
MMPKWIIKPNQTSQKSVMDTGSQTCSVTQGLTGVTPQCNVILNSGSADDQLEVTNLFNSSQFTANGTDKLFTIQVVGFKMPPSMRPASGFTLYTSDSQGNKIN